MHWKMIHNYGTAFDYNGTISIEKDMPNLDLNLSPKSDLASAHFVGKKLK